MGILNRIMFIMSIGLISSVLVFSQVNEAYAGFVICGSDADCDFLINECGPVWSCDFICVATPGALPEGTPCGQTDMCTTGGTCSGPNTPEGQLGLCENNDPIDCDDGEFCTLNSCDSATGCISTPNPDPICNGGGPIGGEMVYMETSALLLAGMQSSLTWLVPSLASAAVAGIILYRIKRM